jgi:hypothetical protein
MSIVVTRENGFVIARTPFYPGFPERARQIGGKWSASGRAWVFDVREEELVRRLILNTFGWDGTYPVEVVDVRLLLAYGGEHGVAGPGRGCSTLFMFGRLIAERPFRDSRVRLGPGVVLLEGGFPPRGGSRKRPDIAALPGTIVLVHDVPFNPEWIAHQAARWPGEEIVSVDKSTRRTVHAPDDSFQTPRSLEVHAGVPTAPDDAPASRYLAIDLD